MMRAPLVIGIAMLVPVAGSAADTSRACIMKATAMLPRIAGLQVMAAKTRPMSQSQLANWKGQSKPIMVDLDTVANNVSERYSYVCASERSGAVFVQRVLE